jgi:uncharacterized LabA/DUF88 family protein
VTQSLRSRPEAKELNPNEEDALRNRLDANLAILIDAENTPHDNMKYILDSCARYGRAIIKRAYGDWTTPNLQMWNSVFREYAIKPMQQYRFTVGKNSSDSALIIDAMDILHRGKIDTFVLVTSDSDFTGLAMRIREEGLTVIGVGRKTTPQSFVKGCEEFILIENLIPPNSIVTTQTSLSPDSTRRSAVKEKDTARIKSTTKVPIAVPVQSSVMALGSTSGAKELMIRAARAAADENGIIAGAYLAVVLRRLDPTFSPKNYGVKKLADFVDLHPDILVPLGKRTNTDPRYKLTDVAS